MAFSYSRDEERFHGDYATREEAIAEALSDLCEGDSFWIGENVPPPPPESLWNADEWLGEVDCQDEYSGDWAEGWHLGMTRELLSELESEVRPIIGKWLDRHGFRPTFWNIDHAEKYRVVDGMAVAVGEPRKETK